MKRIIKFSVEIFFLIVLTILYTGQINAQKTTTETNNGLRTTKFKTDEGTITVYTPADMHAGDVISGTVFTEPEGKNDKEVKKNQDVLNGRVIEMEDKKTPVEKGEEKWQIPTFFPGITTLLKLKDANGKVIGTAEVPVDSIPRSIIPPDVLNENYYLIPDYIQAGRPFQIPGFYDGDFLTTGMTINGVSPTILAESPGLTIFEASPDIVGPSEIVLTEGDLQIKDSLNVLSLNLTAGKLDLLKGEKTTVTVNISGLERLDQNIPYFFENKTPEIISLGGGNKQEITINPDSLSIEGTYTKDFTVIAINTGAFTIFCFIEPCFDFSFISEWWEKIKEKWERAVEYSKALGMLYNDDWSEREEGSRILQEAGEEARGWLDLGKKSEDLEVRRRCIKLIEILECKRIDKALDMIQKEISKAQNELNTGTIDNPRIVTKFNAETAEPFVESAEQWLQHLKQQDWCDPSGEQEQRIKEIENKIGILKREIQLRKNMR